MSKLLTKSAVGTRLDQPVKKYKAGRPPLVWGVVLVYIYYFWLTKAIFLKYNMFSSSLYEEVYIRRRAAGPRKQRRSSFAEAEQFPCREANRSRSRDFVSERHPPRRESSTWGKTVEVDAAKLRAAKNYHIPRGYSLDLWDHTEKPLILAGSVFDSNSFGKWMYDWSTYAYGPESSLAVVAGEMWLCLIRLAGKVKVLENRGRFKKRFRRVGDGLCRSLLAEGTSLWEDFLRLFSRCEKSMYMTTEYIKHRRLAADSAVAFVESVFGVEDRLLRVEALIDEASAWDRRFDDILAEPSLRLVFLTLFYEGLRC